MRRFAALVILIAGLATGLVTAAPAWAQGSAEGIPQNDAAALAIREVITKQIDAFQRDDGAAAFAYASPSIQDKFGTVDNFMAMVRNGYPAVYRPVSYEYGSLLNYRGSPIQLVTFVGADGKVIIARYWMEQQSDGQWKIDGVELREGPGAAV